MASTVWRGHLTFGLVSIPVRLYPAARAKKVKLNHVFRRRPEPEEPDDVTDAPNPIFISKQESAPAILAGPEARVHYAPTVHAFQEDAPAEIVKAFEFEKDRYVPLDRPDLERLAVKTSTSMEISEFVRLDEIDPVFFETSYFVAADPEGEKPYALLFEAMRKSAYVGIASVAMHKREHIVILRPGGKGLLLHTMFYADEVRTEQEFAADPALVAPKELQVAGLLVQALAGSFDPAKYRDTYRERLNELIAGRLEQSAPPAKPPVVDIMSALRDSLAKLKKPPEAVVKQPKRSRRAG